LRQERRFLLPDMVLYLSDRLTLWNEQTITIVFCGNVYPVENLANLQGQPGAVADPEKNLGGAEKHATTTCSSIKTPHKREI